MDVNTTPQEAVVAWRPKYFCSRFSAVSPTVTDTRWQWGVSPPTHHVCRHTLEGDHVHYRCAHRPLSSLQAAMGRCRDIARSTTGWGRCCVTHVTWWAVSRRSRSSPTLTTATVWRWFLARWCKSWRSSGLYYLHQQSDIWSIHSELQLCATSLGDFTFWIRTPS